jgi:hypothetical protein
MTEAYTTRRNQAQNMKNKPDTNREEAPAKQTSIGSPLSRGLLTSWIASVPRLNR